MAHHILESCISCDACVEECPTLSVARAKPHYLIDADTCDNHRACLAVCPVDAIEKLKYDPTQSPSE